MKSPSIDICWRIAEAEAALAGFPLIEPAHFWIGVCKAVDLDLSALLDAAAPEWKVAEERVAAELSEVKEGMAAVGLSPVKLRRALRVELVRKQEATQRPLQRNRRPALRKIVKHGGALASVDGGYLRPARLLVALIEKEDPVVSTAVTKLEHDSFALLQGLRLHLLEGFDSGIPKNENERPVAENDERPKKKTALKRLPGLVNEIAAIFNKAFVRNPEFQFQNTEAYSIQ